MRRKIGFRFVTTAVAVFLLTVAPPAAADHTNPRVPLAPTTGLVTTGIQRPPGDTWTHIANFPGLASEALSGGGTDLEFFKPAGSNDLYGAFGTLGQDNAGSIGQRILQLTKGGAVAPTWVADHGSAHCLPASTSVTGLQHDSQIASRNKVRLLTDTTDAGGRCHDPNGGGIEIIDVSKIHQSTFEPREVHLLRHAGFSHTHTVDAQRPWIVYNSSSDFAAANCTPTATNPCANWIDVLDLRSCFGELSWSLTQRRAACRPSVYRIRFQADWTKQRDQHSGQLEPGSAACHDITFAGNRLYCAAVNATLIIDVSRMFTSSGAVRGTPLPCTVGAGTQTGAMVTDCSANGAGATQAASGWRFLGTFNHPGRDCVPGRDTADIRTCNSNNDVPSDEGVSISHEADPTHDRKFMFVTDERGGGVVPPGSTCFPGIDNPIGAGGAHAFDIRNPANIRYATTPTGDKAVYISDAIVPGPTFCDIHVIELVPGEQRFIAAYYTQGIKIVDYFINSQGRLRFEERASFTLPNANTWAAEHFKIVRNGDGTRTYFIAVDDIHRGIDIVSWRGRPNPTGSGGGGGGGDDDDDRAMAMNMGLLGAAALLLPAAAAVGRRRRRLGEDA